MSKIEQSGPDVVKFVTSLQADLKALDSENKKIVRQLHSLKMENKSQKRELAILYKENDSLKASQEPVTVTGDDIRKALAELRENDPSLLE